MMIDITAYLVAASFLGWLYLGSLRGCFWLPLVPGSSPDPVAWPDIDIIVPARNEAGILPVSLPSLLAQDYPGTWRIILVDDHSADGTADAARATAARKNEPQRLTVITAPDLPQGWNGKVAAMQAGLAESTASYVLFTDADIWHPADHLRRLAARAVDQKLDLVSRMARLHCESAAEKLLIPAFAFFFALLYPFRRVNDPSSPTAAAAGGVMLVRRETLENRGGLAAIKSELIDDCALARLIKFGSPRSPGGASNFASPRMCAACANIRI
jgi:hopene-associated glycosyltransferase HpnB